jgi:hypothetical protein
MEINRTMNLYEITISTGKTIKVNLDPDDTYIKGVSGKKLKTYPRTGWSWYNADIVGVLFNFGLNKTNDWFNNNKDIILDYLNRFVSLSDYDYQIRNMFFRLVQSELFSSGSFNEWRLIVNLLKEAKKDSFKLSVLKKMVGKDWCLDEFKKYYELYTTVLVDYYTSDIVATFEDMNWAGRYESFILYTKKHKAFREGIKHIYANKQKSDKIYETLADKFSELCEGLTDEEASRLTGISIRCCYDVSRRIRDLVDKVDSCEYLIKELGITYKLTNIDNDVQFLNAKWKKEKTAIENARFAKNQSNPCLPFEDDNYRIYIPTTRDDLAKIGKTFSNCANGWEWDNRLRDGRYWLVVVVDKATNEMKVCVDIYCRDKDIGQYLLPYNHYVEYNNPLQAFREKYQHHLTTFKAE